MSLELSSVLNTLAGAALGFAAAVFAEPLRQWIYRPKLLLTFDNDPGCRARTPEQTQLHGGPRPIESTHEAEYIRVKIQNTKPHIAKNCRAYLVGVEKADEHDNFKQTIYGDSIPLPWSCRGNEAYGPLDLARGIVQFIDIVSTRSVAPDFKPEIKPVPYRYFNLFHQHGKYRFTIQVSGENVKPVFIKVIFNWSGVWDKYEACSG
ncbi:MAG: hypothetical protein AB2689_19670 [Candidatus Thiodiazotropha taylori]